MKVGIVGSRTYKDKNAVALAVHEFTRTEYGKVTIISGGAVGVDTWAKYYADQFGLECIEYKPKYETFGKRAPIFRNDTIVNEADRVIAFWDGTSTGTRDVISKCIDRRKDLEIIFDK